MSKTAEKDTNDQNLEDILQLVSFYIGQEEFAIDILNVQSVNKMSEITVIPNCPDFMEGVINIRGDVIPVINLRAKLGLPFAAYNDKTRIIIVEFAGKTIGFIVDSVNKVIQINKNVTEPPAKMVADNIDSDYITSVAKLVDRLVIIIDVRKILPTIELTELQKI